MLRNYAIPWIFERMNWKNYDGTLFSIKYQVKLFKHKAKTIME